MSRAEGRAMPTPDRLLPAGKSEAQLSNRWVHSSYCTRIASNVQ